jgi:organic hydroperoxide reductase OsmC/OhrA
VKISATVDNRLDHNGVLLTTGGSEHAIDVPVRSTGYGSAANGGELLCLALAACYCNDIYREAAKRSIEVIGVRVTARAEFPSEGHPASRLAYHAAVRARATETAIRDLIVHTDTVAEVQNTLRLGMRVELESFDAIVAPGDEAAS